MTDRNGILTAGNFLVDYVKLIDGYPEEDMLTLILGQTKSNGGGPYNMAKNLSLMKAPFPIQAAALLGDDVNGRWILSDLEAHGVDVSLVRFTDARGTSYTDVMSNLRNGRRTFFHDPGTNALFDGAQVDFTETSAKILHLGLLMILETMDSFAEDGRTHAAHFLQRASEAGLITSIDLVSTEHPRFREIALSAIPHADYVIINELEVSRILGRTVPGDSVEAMLDAAGELLALGAGKAVVIHSADGAVHAGHAGTESLGSLVLPGGFIRGANGAGDAFASGFLYAVHEGWTVAEQLRLGICAAAACLADTTPSGGLLPMEQCLALGERYGFRIIPE